MTIPVMTMIILGFIIIFVSFFISEKLTKKEDSFNIDLLTINDDYEFSERELHIIKRKIEDVIAKQAKDILYETNESLSNMANEKTMALGDYAVAVCDEIEKNHKEAMFLYSMLDDKQKEIMNTVKAVDEANRNVKETITEARKQASASGVMMESGKQASISEMIAGTKKQVSTSETDTEVKSQTTPLEPKKESVKKQSAIEQLTALSKMQKETNLSIDKLDDVSTNEMSLKTDFSGISEKQDDTVSENASWETEKDLDIDGILAEIDQTDINFDEVLEEFNEKENSNDIILELHKNGNSIIDIAKQLGLGVGEVKLVIDLYQGE